MLELLLDPGRFPIFAPLVNEGNVHVESSSQSDGWKIEPKKNQKSLGLDDFCHDHCASSATAGQHIVDDYIAFQNMLEIHS